MNNENPDWFVPFEDLFAEQGSLRPLAIVEIKKAIERLQVNLSNLSEHDVPRLALAIAETSLGIQWLERSVTLAEGTLKN